VLDNWPSLIEKLQSERDLARENAEYLSTLQEYFVVSIIAIIFFPFFPLLVIVKIYEKKNNPLKLQTFPSTLFYCHQNMSQD
jgi:hypothetical protein